METVRNYNFEDEIEQKKAYQELKNNSIESQIKADEKVDLIFMRRIWSKYILISIVGLIIFDVFVVLALGLHWISFEANYLVPVFIGESMFKMFGLAWIVVKFLFHKDSLV